MASLQFNLPDNISWGDYLLDGRQVTLTVEVKKKTTPETKTETVHVQKEDSVTPVVDSEVRIRRMPWCKRGNSCSWSNCKFRHERCTHFDRWKSTGCRGTGCRALKYDPLSIKCPADGGCQYDHRNMADLKEFIETIDINTKQDLVDNFYRVGLYHMYDEVYDTTNMSKEDKQLLIRSLKAAREDEVLQYGEDGDDFTIHFTE